MRLNALGVTFEMPVRYNEPDANGVAYTRQAIVNATEVRHDLPLELLTKDGELLVVGSIKDIELVENTEKTEGCIKCSGVIWNGGTYEHVGIDNNKVVDMDIMSVCISLK